MYGKLWENSRDDATWSVTVGIWSKILEKYPEKVLIDSALNCWRFHIVFPPTLPQFLEIVKKYNTDFISLKITNKNSICDGNKEIALSAINNCKKIINENL